MPQNTKSSAEAKKVIGRILSGADEAKCDERAGQRVTYIHRFV